MKNILKDLKRRDHKRYLGGLDVFNLKSATPFPKCYLHKEKWTFDS